MKYSMRHLASAELTYPCPDIDTLTNIQYGEEQKSDQMANLDECPL